MKKCSCLLTLAIFLAFLSQVLIVKKSVKKSNIELRSFRIRGLVYGLFYELENLKDDEWKMGGENKSTSFCTIFYASFWPISLVLLPIKRPKVSCWCILSISKCVFDQDFSFSSDFALSRGKFWSNHKLFGGFSWQDWNFTPFENFLTQIFACNT